MPIYEFVCLDCDKVFESLVMSSDSEVRCPGCDSTRLERLMSTFARAAAESASLGGCSGGTGGFS